MDKLKRTCSLKMPKIYLRYCVLLGHSSFWPADAVSAEPPLVFSGVIEFDFLMLPGK